NVAGAYGFVEKGARLFAPADERHLFDDVVSYWRDPANRWHLYHHQPGPQVLARPIAVADGVREGDTISWRGYTIYVLDTPGATDGSVSYRIDMGDERVCFVGDALYGPGQLWDLASLQKGAGDIRDYHGFIGNRRKLIPSLQKLAASEASVLVPSHGAPIHDPGAAIELLLTRLDAVWRNYVAISALNHYFPGFLDEPLSASEGAAWRMPPAATSQPPAFIRRCPETTSFVVVSDSGAALLIDCGQPAVVNTLQAWLANGEIGAVEGCWITHYHDDHVDALPLLREAFDCPIFTDRHLAEIIEHPRRFHLPCISPQATPVTRATREGESWAWHEFTLTACHFPGQTYYHSGLLVEGHGTSVCFAGDSGAPTGLDDYCAPNRTFLGAGRGFRRCIELWRAWRPAYIINEHQDQAFHFSDDELDTMEELLAQRELLFAEILPWEHPDFGADEYWVRVYPYEQDVAPGEPFELSVLFTNHGNEAVAACAVPVLPPGWRWDANRSQPEVRVPARTEGIAADWCANPDRAARLRIVSPADAAPGQVVIPFQVTWGGRYLGQFRHALVNVERPSPADR
ncbi:MAG: MBL fold metallo-hydrolase, partial [Anaerolineales bacterium]|nr:MBL fold metallo-hydrolase [Anaerolineales bacterium]